VELIRIGAGGNNNQRTPGWNFNQGRGKAASPLSFYSKTPFNWKTCTGDAQAIKKKLANYR
jgi:hypothetical protein